jgi:hypothetical protein
LCLLPFQPCLYLSGPGTKSTIAVWRSLWYLGFSYPRSHSSKLVGSNIHTFLQLQSCFYSAILFSASFALAIYVWSITHDQRWS